MGFVLWRVGPTGIESQGSLAASTGRGLRQGLVGPFPVAGVSEGIKGGPLLQCGGVRRLGGLGLQGAGETLQATVLLRVSRGDAFGTDTQLDPPHRKGGQGSRADSVKG